MRFVNLAVTALAVLPVALAVDRPKQILVWFEGGAPESVVKAVSEACANAGGQVTHVFSLISGFSAVASDTALDAVRSLSTQTFSQYILRIEEDKEVKGFDKRAEIQ